MRMGAVLKMRGRCPPAGRRCAAHGRARLRQSAEIAAVLRVGVGSGRAEIEQHLPFVSERPRADALERTLDLSRVRRDQLDV